GSFASTLIKALLRRTARTHHFTQEHPSRKGQTRRGAGTQSHGSGHEPDSRVTEGGVTVAPEERGGLPQGRPLSSKVPVARVLFVGGLPVSVSHSAQSSWWPVQVAPEFSTLPGLLPPRMPTGAR